METDKPPSGVDYPRTSEEMDECFRTEAGCRAYIQSLRWPDGFVCGRCGVVGEPWVTARGVFRCKACDMGTSLTAGTVFQDTRKPLRAHMVPRDVVHHQPEERGERAGLAASAGAGKLRNGVDVDAQVAQGNGQAGTRSACRRGRD